MSKRITIGRDASNTISVSQRYDTVSNMHADIEETNSGKLYIIDHSRNGTIINGHKIRNERMEIVLGDDIRLSNVYQLSWNELRTFFPSLHFPTTPLNGGNSAPHQPMSRMTERHDTPHSPLYGAYDSSFDGGKDSGIDIERSKGRWNWGAFLLGWIWGVGHFCWWPLWTILGVGFVAGIIMIIVPLAGLLAEFASSVIFLVLHIYLGIKGNSIAWSNGCFDNVEHAYRKERQWAIAGLIVWGVYLLIVLIVLVSFFSVLNSLL